MINVSSEFKRLLYSGEGNFVVDATITLSNNTVLNVSNSRIMSNGLEIDDAVGDDNDFNCIGSTIVNGCELILYNNDEIYSNYDFINAKVSIVVKLMTSNGYESVQKGTYTVDAAAFSDVSVTLTLLDNMCQFDRPYDSYGIYRANTTIYDVVMDACTKCGVTPASTLMTDMPNEDFVVAGKPKDNTTYREVIGWCAAIAGCFARCTPDGKLEFAWFDVDKFDLDEGTDGGVFDSHTPYYSTGDTLNGGTFNPWNDPSDADGGVFTDRSGIHYISSLMSQNIGVDDVVITAVQIAYDVETDNKVETKYYPTTITNDKYVISIGSIPFINADNVASFYHTLFVRLFGLSFRTCNITQTHDPTIEAGDVAWLWDTKGEKHRVLITRTTFAVAGLQTIVCGAKTPARNSATQMTALAKAEARSNRRLNDEKSIRQQLEENFNDYVANASGLYLSEIIDSSTGARIIYGHDKPLLAESTMVLKINNSAIAMTANYSGSDATTTWYGFQFDGTWLANIISTVSLFFNYARGGTLKLGGAGNGNGLLEVYNASNQLIGSWDKEGISAVGKLTIKDGNVYTKIETLQRGYIYWGSSSPEVRWYSTNGLSVYREVNGEAVSKISFFPLNGAYEEQIMSGGYQKTLFFPDSSSSGDACFLNIDKDKIRLLRIGYGSGSSSNIEYPVLIDDDQTLFGTFKNKIHINKSARSSSGSDIYICANATTYGGTATNAPVFLFLGNDTDFSDYNGIMLKGGNNYIKVKSAGYININSGSLKIDNGALECSASVIRYNGTQLHAVSSSSRRYKHDINYSLTEDRDYHKLLDLPVAEFVFNEGHTLEYADMEGQIIPGIIAEDVEKIYPSATIHKDGQVESWDERRIIPGMLALIQEQNKRIQELENKLAKLEQVVLNLM